MKTQSPAPATRPGRRSALFLLLVSALHGQTTTPPSPAQPPADDSELLVLSPFVVTAEEDTDRYQAQSTLAGTRVRTDLKDLASAISVVTKQFLRDTGATNSSSLLQYTTNTEVGGIYGNFGGIGTTFAEGASEGANLSRPNANTRVRGLDSADNTRDYFLTNIPWDSFNVDRVDIQRGPNSILFGIGSPAGIINSSVNSAGFKNAYQLENRYGSYGSVRTTVDFNQVLIAHQLSARLSVLDDHTYYRQDPAYSRDRRLFGAVRWDPKLLSREDARTSLRANFERGQVEANHPRILPPTDGITPFFDSTTFNRTVYDPYYAWTAGILAKGDGTTVTQPGETKNFWLQQNYAGQHIETSPVFYYDNLSAGPGAPIRVVGMGPGGSGPVSFFAIRPDGNRDSQISGYPFGSRVGIGTFNQYTIGANRYNATMYPGAQSGLYKSRSLSDPTIFDFNNHLIDGPNKHESQSWTAFNLAADQTFWDNRLGFQIVYDHQAYQERQEGNLNSPSISVDVNANAEDTLPWAYGGVAKYNGSGTAGTNPNAGRAYIGGSSSGTGNSADSTRDGLRATVTGELRAADFVHSPAIARLLGRHVITGLLSKDVYQEEARGWNRYGVEGAWDALIGTGPGPNGEGIATLLNNTRLISWNSYVSAPLFNATSAAGLNIKPITTVQAPSGSVNVRYFDSHWKWPTAAANANYVDPAAPWTNPTTFPIVAGASTQSENPANYVGWTNRSFRILNADAGDINSLYTRGSKLKQVNTSAGATWQGFLWDDTVVATFGWRRDTQVQRSGNAVVSPATGAADMNYELQPEEYKVTGNSQSWGVVVHEPKGLRNQLPWGTNISFLFDVGHNSRVENRFSFQGDPLPNAKGKTTDFGVVVSTLNDRLQLKVTRYKTTVMDANLASTMSSEGTLGANAYLAYYLPAWGLGDVLQAVAGMQGDHAADGSAYNWNWTAAAHPGEPIYENVSSPQYQNDPVTIAEKRAIDAFLAGMPSQAWFDAYGFPVNVAEAKAKHYQRAVGGWSVSQGNWAIRPSGGGTIHGVAPTGTVDNESKGVELELTGKFTDNWNVSFNASKQTAAQISLGSALKEFMDANAAWYATPAGDIRLWWGGDQGLRDYWDQNIGAAYRFQAQTNGKYVPEMSPWRTNLVTNYTFTRGALKGAFVGGGYRWQDGVILGYALNAAKDNLDVNHPYWGQSEDAVDLWFGYSRKLTKRINWRVQLNLRDVGEKPHLQAVSVQPDGSAAMYRIRDGTVWTLTNTIDF